MSELSDALRAEKTRIDERETAQQMQQRWDAMREARRVRLRLAGDEFLERMKRAGVPGVERFVRYVGPGPEDAGPKNLPTSFQGWDFGVAILGGRTAWIATDGTIYGAAGDRRLPGLPIDVVFYSDEDVTEVIAGLARVLASHDA